MLVILKENKIKNERYTYRYFLLTIVQYITFFQILIFILKNAHLNYVDIVPLDNLFDFYGLPFKFLLIYYIFIFRYKMA